jgi:hypothetical protein
MYAVDGVYPAPSFFTVNSTNGAVTIIKDLREDGKAQATWVIPHHGSLLQ